MILETIGTPALWTGFTGFILLMLVLDLGLFHRRAHVVQIREAIIWVGVWIALALVFNLGIWHWFGSERALEFLTGYLIEKALSVDNLFIFLIIFSYFSVPAALQHRILFFGILGALIMRAIFIALGALLLQKFSWIIYPFGLILILTAIRLFFQKESDVHPENNILIKLFKKLVPHASLFLVVLVTIEVTDLIFAVDSIPAIFAVTSDPFIVYTSNIFALLGLRSLYFALASMMGKFYYLKTGLACVLAFVGVKMLLSELIHIHVAISLLVIILILGTATVASLLFPPAI